MIIHTENIVLTTNPAILHYHYYGVVDKPNNRLCFHLY